MNNLDTTHATRVNEKKITQAKKKGINVSKVFREALDEALKIKTCSKCGQVIKNV